MTTLFMQLHDLQACGTELITLVGVVKDGQAYLKLTICTNE